MLSGGASGVFSMSGISCGVKYGSALSVCAIAVAHVMVANRVATISLRVFIVGLFCGLYRCYKNILHKKLFFCRLLFLLLFLPFIFFLFFVMRVGSIGVVAWRRGQKHEYEQYEVANGYDAKQ